MPGVEYKKVETKQTGWQIVSCMGREWWRERGRRYSEALRVIITKLLLL
jgi:hypothetical protein